jgi:hypothetical protein
MLYMLRKVQGYGEKVQGYGEKVQGYGEGYLRIKVKFFCLTYFTFSFILPVSILISEVCS